MTLERGTPVIPAAWYPDPADPDRLRWWDGAAWTQHTTSVEPALPREIAVRPDDWSIWQGSATPYTGELPRVEADDREVPARRPLRAWLPAIGAALVACGAVASIASRLVVSGAPVEAELSDALPAEPAAAAAASPRAADVAPTDDPADPALMAAWVADQLAAEGMTALSVECDSPAGDPATASCTALLEGVAALLVVRPVAGDGAVGFEVVSRDLVSTLAL